MYKNQLLIYVLACVVVGCASAPTPSATNDGVALAARKNRLANTDNGLEVLRWTVLDHPNRLQTTLLKYANGEAVPAPTAERLQRNGFRMLRMPADQVEALLAELGGATIESNEWQGQVHQWRALLDRPVETAGRAIAVDGHVRRYDRGEFRLLVRSWIVPMEDGVRMQFEMLPQHHRSQTNNLRKLLGEQQTQVDGFAACALDLQLEPGYAYVLVGEPPQAKWIAPGAEAAPDQPAAIPPRFARTPRVGPSDLFANEEATPLTIGELLLPRAAKPASRGILVFVPKVSPDLLLSHQRGVPAVAARSPAN